VPRRQPGECVDLVKIDGESVSFDLAGSEELLTTETQRSRTLKVTSCSNVRLSSGEHTLDGTISSEAALRNLLLLPKDFEFPEAEANQVSIRPSLNGEQDGLRVSAAKKTVVTNGQAYGPGWYGTVGANGSTRSESWNTLNGWTVPAGNTRLSTSYQPQRWYIAALVISSFGLAISLSMAWPTVRVPPRSRGTKRSRRLPKLPLIGNSSRRPKASAQESPK
jgi:hypothetical protein